MKNDLRNLPVFEYLDEVLQSVQSAHCTLLTATPGSGKTLLVAPHIVKNSNLRVAMLQPRRVAAQLSAQSIAMFNDWKLGEEVGLVMRNVHRRSSRTRLTIMTEGVLSRMLAAGEVEKNFDLIVLDEFHERSVHTDLACAWVKKHKKVGLLVMSATMETEPLIRYFDRAKTFEIEGRAFPVESHYLKRALNFHNKNEFDQKFVEVCQLALDSHRDGNILAFLPGSADIERLRNLLEGNEAVRPHSIEVHVLYGRASKDQQKRALADDNKRKLILATNIAETSVTLPDVKVVIDSGLQKESSYNPKTGVRSLATRRIALDSATQRAGRAGRVREGACYKLWTMADEQRFRATTPAEIHRMDPVEILIKIMSFDEELESIEFLEPIDTDQLSLAKKRLEISGCVEGGKLTSSGRWVSQFPGDFSYALLVAVSLTKSYFDEALLTVLILQEGDPAPFLSRQHNPDSLDDLRLRLNWLKENQNHQYHDLAQKLKKQVLSIAGSLDKMPDLQSLEEALVFAFPHRLCRFRKGKVKSAIMSTGRGVSVESGKAGKEAEFFLALKIMDHRLHGQSESEVRFLFNCSKKTIRSVFDSHIQDVTRIEPGEKKQGPRATVYQSFWELPLEEPRGVPIEKEHLKNHLKKQFAEDFRKALSEKNLTLDFVERVLFCREHNIEMAWPGFTSEDWDLVIDAIDSEKKDFNISDEEWLQAVQMLFAEDQLAFIQSFAPQFLATKTRKYNPISYSDPRQPKVSLILQEAFDFKESPKIGNGSVVLALELLAPSRRPIEVSLDMKRFWISSYPEIRKQYRGRYPKHSWPEF